VGALAVLSAFHASAQNALPNLRPPYAPRPADKYWQYEWHAENRLPSGVRTNIDLNVRGAWELTKGEGVTIAIADDGVELDHPDLAANAVAGLHYDFDLGITNGNHRVAADWHGTQAIGLVSAALDGAGMVGIAPATKFASWNIYPENGGGARSFITSDKMARVYEYQNDVVSIQLHNWKETQNYLRQIPMDPREDAAISNAVTLGRGGKGVVMIRPAGNLHFDRNNQTFIGRNANDDPLTSDPRAIAVAASRADGRVASYSERGACILVSAPSGDSAFGFNNIFTTDRVGTAGANQITFPSDPTLNNYVFDSLGFTGTSASTPMIAGICSLILSANPNLTYRDVQQVLIHASKHVDTADPDLRRNGAGYWVSHRQGYGIPDAAEAVRVAKAWVNRPPAVRVTTPSDLIAPIAIEDASLRAVIEAPGGTNSYVGFPSYGVQPDDPTAKLELVDVGLAQLPITQNVQGKGVLIQRGIISFVDKINNVAAAGAAFAIIYNNTDTPPLATMGNSDFMSIPTISIRKSEGEALKARLANESALRAQLRGTPAVAHFTAPGNMLCEHVGVRIRTTHPARQDLRITLKSPSGNRSILQAFNFDENPGPVDWTYWSTQHFYEPSGGAWTLEVTDEVEEFVGSLVGAELIIEGTPLLDTDRDGLDDTWELTNFTSLVQNALGDTDKDRSWNAREQALRTNPKIEETPFKLNIARLDTNHFRLAFPSHAGTNTIHLHPTIVSDGPAPYPTQEGETEVIVRELEAKQFFTVEKPAETP
jgi:subtilisin family serine protease/subtilisin-like proprotein convertase family protein